MEVTYKTEKVKGTLNSGYSPFFAKAHTTFGGHILYFGSFNEGRCDIIIEKSTGRRCFSPLPIPTKTPLDKSIAQLMEEFYKQVRGCKMGDFHLVVEGYKLYLCQHQYVNFISPWEISLLTNL